MKLDLLSVFLLLVIGALVAVATDQGCRKSAYKQKAAEFETRYTACLNAPVQIDTINDTIYLPGGTIIRPVPVIQKVYDTVYVNKMETWYDSTYRDKDGIRFRWRAHAAGSINTIRFSDFVIPYRTIIETRTVDTCILKGPVITYSPKNHWGMYAGVYAGNLKHLPGVDVGLWFTWKDKWGLMGGAMYDPSLTKAYGTIKATFTFK
jgi:hypothetical protein